MMAMGFWQLRWFKRLVIWGLVPLALGYAIFEINYPTCTFRYKLTAEVMTPDGLKTGSSVIEVSYSHNADWGGGETSNLNMTGEAVYVDLGSGKNLFVMLTNSASGREKNSSRNYQPLEGALDAFALPLKALDLNWTFGQERQLCADVGRVPLDQAFVVQRENLPTLVSFGSLKDPDSLAIVEPGGLDKVVGEGFGLKNVLLERTRKPVTKNGFSLFPWWEQKKNDWEHVIAIGKDDALIDQLFYTAFTQPNDIEYKELKK
jgi:hypothetical protein